MKKGIEMTDIFTNATPRPWATDMRTHATDIVSDGNVVADCDFWADTMVCEANAALIVHCVNNFKALKARNAELTEALEKIAADASVPLDKLPDYHQPNGWRDVATARIDIARATLAKAKGGAA